MASAEIALVFDLKVGVGCQDRLCMNSYAEETQAKWESRYVREVLPHSWKKRVYILYAYISKLQSDEKKVTSSIKCSNKVLNVLM